MSEEKIIKEFIEKISNQQEIDPEIQKVINKNFLGMIEPL